MPNKDRNIPKRRFKEFENEDAWELRKLGELADIVRGASPRPIQDPKWFDEQSEIGWLRISDVTEQDGRIYHLEQKISKLGQQKTRVLVEPHLLLSIAATVGKPVVNYVKTGVHDGFLIFLEPRFEQEFMFQWLEMFRSSWSKYGQPGSQVNLNSDLVKNQELSIPTLPEQKAIGTFFSTLDQQITLHQRKLDKLKHVKQAYLSEMFPAEGERVPKRRFPGFTDDWELRKLGELMNENSERTSDFANNPLYSLTIENGITPKTERYERSSLVTKQEDLFKIVKPNEFVTNPMNLRFGALGYNSNSFRISVSGYYDVFSIDENRCSNYWYAFFKTDRALSILDNVSTGSLIEKRRVKYSTLRQISFRMPCELDEKIKIGNFFSTLDRHITLHQRKLEKLKNLKKALLNELFV
ncbi:TPA: restriction endonuclease subunit S [Streptococcus suis]